MDPYLMTLLDRVHTLANILSVLFGLATCFTSIGWLMARFADDIPDTDREALSAIFIYVGVGFILTTCVMLVTPDAETYRAMHAVSEEIEK